MVPTGSKTGPALLAESGEDTTRAEGTSAGRRAPRSPKLPRRCEPYLFLPPSTSCHRWGLECRAGVPVRGSSPTEGRRRYASPRRETAARRPRCFPPPGTDVHGGLLPLRSPEGSLPTRTTLSGDHRFLIRTSEDDHECCGDLAENRAATPLVPHAIARLRLRWAMLPAGRPLAGHRPDPVPWISSEGSSQHRAARSSRTVTGKQVPDSVTSP